MGSDRPPIQIGIGRWIGIGASPAAVIVSNVPAWVTDGSVHSRRISSICSSEPTATLIEPLTERLVLHVVPADADPESEATAGEQIHLGGLLRDQRGLALGEDDHAGHELE